MNKSEYVSYLLDDLEELLADEAKSSYHLSAAKTFDDDKDPILLVDYPSSSMRAYVIPYSKRIVKDANNYREITMNFVTQLRELKENIILDINNFEHALNNTNDFMNISTNTEIAMPAPIARLHSDEYYEEYDTEDYAEFCDTVHDWLRDYEVEHNCDIYGADYGALYDDYNDNDDSFLETMLNNLDKFDITYHTVSEDRQEESNNAVQDLTSTEEQESENPLDTNERIVLNHTEDYYDDFDTDDYEEFKNAVNDYIEDYNKTVSEDKRVGSLSEFMLEDLYENDYLDNDDSFLEVMEDNVGKIDFEAIEHHNLIPDENGYIPHHARNYYEDYDTDYLDEFTETAKEWIEDYEHLNGVTVTIDEDAFDKLNDIYQDNDYSFNATMVNNIGKLFYITNHPEEYYNRLDGIINDEDHFVKNAKEWINDNSKYLVDLDKNDINNIDYEDIYDNYCNNGISFVDTMLNSMVDYGYLKEDPREGRVFESPERHTPVENIDTHIQNRRNTLELRELYNEAKDFDNVKDKVRNFNLSENDLANPNIYHNDDGVGLIIIFDENTKLKVSNNLFDKWVTDYFVDYIADCVIENERREDTLYSEETQDISLD
jgi:hypothetical protein